MVPPPGIGSFVSIGFISNGAVDREQRLGEQVLAHRGELRLQAVDHDVLHWPVADDVEHVREPNDMVQVGMREIDVERIGRQMVAHTVHGRARVEHDS